MLKRIGQLVPLLLGLLFLYSGIHKLLSPGQATYALLSLDLPQWLARWTIISVTALELYLGTLLVRKIDLRYALAAATVLMFAFTVFLWYLSTQAHPPACGCMGLTWAFTSGKRGAIIGIARNCTILWLLSISYNYYFRRPQAPSGAPAEAMGLNRLAPGNSEASANSPAAQ